MTQFAEGASMSQKTSRFRLERDVHAHASAVSSPDTQAGARVGRITAVPDQTDASAGMGSSTSG